MGIKFKVIAGFFALVIASTGVWGAVSAQGTNSGSAKEDVAINLRVSRDQTIPVEKRPEFVNSQHSLARTTSNYVENLLDAARQGGDVLKFNCLDDKVTQIHVHLKGIEERRGAYTTASNSSDSNKANQQFIILNIYFDRIRGLKAEAESCIGEVDVVIGNTTTTFTVDDNITIEDPSEEEDLAPVIEGPPPHGSGYF